MMRCWPPSRPTTPGSRRADAEPSRRPDLRPRPAREAGDAGSLRQALAGHAVMRIAPMSIGRSRARARLGRRRRLEPRPRRCRGLPRRRSRRLPDGLGRRARRWPRSPSSGTARLRLPRPLHRAATGWRGQGHGRAIWEAGLALLGDRTVGLDGVAEQQANYAPRRLRALAPHPPLPRQPIEPRRPSERGRPSAPEHLPALLALDREASGVDRAAYLTRLVPRRAAPAHARARARRRGRRLRHHPRLPRRRQGRPAARRRSARRRRRSSRRSPPSPRRRAASPSTFPSPTTPASPSPAISALRPVFETARMFRGPPPELDHAAVFGEVSLELG